MASVVDKLHYGIAVWKTFKSRLDRINVDIANRPAPLMVILFLSIAASNPVFLNSLPVVLPLCVALFCVFFLARHVPDSNKNDTDALKESALWAFRDPRVRRILPLLIVSSVLFGFLIASLEARPHFYLTMLTNLTFVVIALSCTQAALGLSDVHGRIFRKDRLWKGGRAVKVALLALVGTTCFLSFLSLASLRGDNSILWSLFLLTTTYWLTLYVQPRILLHDAIEIS